MRDPASILKATELRATLNLTQLVALLMMAIVRFTTDVEFFAGLGSRSRVSSGAMYGVVGRKAWCGW
ncbi:hypothetical protein AB0O75_24850 [Streptomyces sp. NPDC088921]|uniref:hypothetical protein n=1 Tax=unclassified Streptomyces TaxID=2593676 RepID=UPI00342C22F8